MGSGTPWPRHRLLAYLQDQQGLVSLTLKSDKRRRQELLGGPISFLLCLQEASVSTSRKWRETVPTRLTVPSPETAQGSRNMGRGGRMDQGRRKTPLCEIQTTMTPLQKEVAAPQSPGLDGPVPFFSYRARPFPEMKSSADAHSAKTWSRSLPSPPSSSNYV